MQNRYFILLLTFLALFNFNDLKAQQKDIYTFSANKLTYSQDDNIIEETGNVVSKNQKSMKHKLNKNQIFEDEIKEELDYHHTNNNSKQIGLDIEDINDFNNIKSHIDAIQGFFNMIMRSNGPTSDDTEYVRIVSTEKSGSTLQMRARLGQVARAAPL